jgi:hypothetical protein
MPPSTPYTNLLLPTPRTKEMAARIMTEFPALTMTRIEKMMRRISLRAGVVKLSHDFYRLAWESALHTILAILVPACHRTFLIQELRGDLKQVYEPCRFRHRSAAFLLAHHDGLTTRRRVQQKMQLLPCESIRDVPPFPYFRRLRPRDSVRLPQRHGHHVLVPRQLEEAALNLPTVPKRVYGAGWHVGRGSTLEQEINRAEAMYTTEEEQEAVQDVDDAFKWDSEGNDGLTAAAHYLDILEEDDDEEEYDWDMGDNDDEDTEGDDDHDADEDDRAEMMI